MNIEAANAGAEIQFGSTRLPYTVWRSPRRRTVSIAVSLRDGIVLTAPVNTPSLRLAEVVKQRAPWILRQLCRQRELVRVRPREFVSGESFLYLGRQYRLRVTSGMREVSLRGPWLCVPPNETQKALITWYKRHAQVRLLERVAIWAQRIRVQTGSVIVRSPTKRWASCDVRGGLRFNWRVIQAAMPLVDYIVVHELTHLIHRNHTPDFWRDVGHHIPDYDARRASLRRLGPTLEW